MAFPKRPALRGFVDGRWALAFTFLYPVLFSNGGLHPRKGRFYATSRSLVWLGLGCCPAPRKRTRCATGANNRRLHLQCETIRFRRIRNLSNREHVVVAVISKRFNDLLRFFRSQFIPIDFNAHVRSPLHLHFRCALRSKLFCRSHLFQILLTTFCEGLSVSFLTECIHHRNHQFLFFLTERIV